MGKIFKPATLFCLVFVVAPFLLTSPSYAFSWVIFQKPEAYVAEGQFSEAIWEEMKQQAQTDFEYMVSLCAKHERITDRQLTIDPLQTNQLVLEVDEDGRVTGQGELGHFRYRTYCAHTDGDRHSGSTGNSCDYYEWWSFSGKASGGNLYGTVKVAEVFYDYETGEEIEGGEESLPMAWDWSARKEGEKITGVVKGGLRGSRGDLEFTAEVVESKKVSEEAVPEGERTLSITDINGQPLASGQAKIIFKDGTTEEIAIRDGRLVYDPGLVEKVLITDANDAGRRLILQNVFLRQDQVTMASEEEWLERLMSELQELAKLFNQGEAIDIEEHFKFDPQAKDNEYRRTMFEFLREGGWLGKWGWKDRIKFDVEALGWTGDATTVIHEVIGHGFTEGIGEGNRLKYAGGAHEDPWQPVTDERSILNPLRWFGKEHAPLSEKKARGAAFAEGWAQYVGDKWDRQLRGVADEESEFTADNAQRKIAWGKKEAYGQLYAEVGYGAKVENVVATVFNEIYRNRTIREAIEDFVKMRAEYRKTYGRNWQNINDFLEQKLAWTDDPEERRKIEELIYKLSLERYPRRQDYESDKAYREALDRLNQRDSGD